MPVAHSLIRRQYQHLRWLTITLLVFANFLVFFLSFKTEYDSKSQYELRSRTLTQNIAAAIDQDLTGSFGKIDLALTALADELERELALRSVNLPQAMHYMDRMASRLPEVEAFRAEDANGWVILATGKTQHERTNVSDRDYFVQLRKEDTGKMVVTKPVLGRIDHRYLIIFARRYNYPDGRFGGVVHATVTVNHFYQLLARYKLGARDTMVLRDSDLGLITRYPAITDRQAGVTGHNQVSAELRQLASSGVLTGAYHTGNGSEKLERDYAYRRMEHAHWSIVVGISTDDNLQGWNASVYKTSAQALSFLALSMFTGFLLLRLFARAELREQTLLDGEARLRDAQSVARLGSFEWNFKSDTIDWSDEHFRLWGLPAQSVTPNYALFRKGVHPDDVAAVDAALQNALKSGDTYRCEYRVVWPDGSEHFVLGQGSITRDAAGNPVQMFGTVLDLTHHKTIDEQIKRLAFYDPLTNLPNRRLLLDRLQRALASSNRHHRHGALLLLDLDNFKILNDTLGHDVGDKFLVEVAQRLIACVREGDTVARQGGDEFVIILEELDENERAAVQAEVVASKIQQAICRPYELDRLVPGGFAKAQNYHFTSSIGIALFKDSSASVDELLKRADTAMYQAKGAGRNNFRFFDPQMQATVTARAVLDHELREAIQEKQFVLYYQPQVNAEGLLIGAEALLRWQHPQRGLLAPGAFIHEAELSGLILPIGHWVLEAACQQLREWGSSLTEEQVFTVSVNVSARQFRDPRFVDDVIAAVNDAGVDPRRIKLELTESMLLDDVEGTIKKMSALQALGIRFSLDDFGTGYSSLSYLKRLPLHQLKIDQSFVRDILTDNNDVAIARTIIALANNIGVQVIAEGVESREQWAAMAEYGCNFYQGYYFGRPVPATELTLKVLVYQ